MFFWIRKEGILKYIVKFLDCIKINYNGYVILYFLFIFYVKYISIFYKKYRYICIICIILRSICLINFIFDCMNRVMLLMRKGSNLCVNV